MDNKLLARSFRLASKFFSDLAEIYDGAKPVTQAPVEVAGAKHKAKEEEKKSQKAVAATPASPKEAAKKPRKKKTDDPALAGIKRPLSAYLLYTNHRRATLQKENPGVGITELSKAMGKEWQEMSEDQKRKWNAKAAELKTEYLLKKGEAISKNNVPLKPATKKVLAASGSLSSLSSIEEPSHKHAPAKKATPAYDSDSSSL